MIETSVEEVANSPARTISPEVGLQQAATRLAGYGIGSLVVTEGEAVVGILTESDVVAVVAAGQDPSEIPVRDAMSAPVVTVAPDDPIDRAATLLRDNRIKKLPVVEGEKLVGIVTAADLARYMPQYRLKVTSDRQDAA